MPRSPSKRASVVLDGSNIVYGGASGDNEIDGHRLVSAVKLYKSKGYKVFPRMKKGTLSRMRNKEIKGYDALKRMTKDSSAQLRTYRKDDDLAIIELALSDEVDGWIVTNDTFDKTARRLDKNGKAKPRERQIYAKEYDWDDIDSRLWGIKKSRTKGYFSGSYYKPNETWHVEGSQFFHRGLKRAPFDSISFDPFSLVRNELDQIEKSIGVIDSQSENLDKSDSKLKERLKKELLHMHPHLRNMREILPEPSIPDEKTLRTLLVVDLRELCGQLGLTKSGRKSELIERILDSQEKDA